MSRNEGLRQGEPVRVMISEMPVIVRSLDELEGLGIGWCDHIDLSISYIEEDERPKEWRCPECGGTRFEDVYRDDMQSGLKGSSFTAELDVEGE